MITDPLNKNCFLPPKENHYAAAARGHAVKSFDPAVPDDWLQASRNGGMTRMNRVHLQMGQVYYRFCDAGRFAADWERQAKGPWWMEAESFFEIQRFARAHAHIRDFAAQHGQSGLSYSTQLHFAVPYEWGDCGCVVMARLVQRIDAWKGWGGTALLADDPARRDARDGGAKFIPLQKPEIYQLYIPEVWTHFSVAFEVIDKGSAHKFA